MCMYVCMYVCMHARTHARTHVRTYVRMYVCMYLHTGSACVNKETRILLSMNQLNNVNWFFEQTTAECFVFFLILSFTLCMYKNFFRDFSQIHQRIFFSLFRLYFIICTFWCITCCNVKLFVWQVQGVRLIPVSSYEVLVTWEDVESRYNVSTVYLIS